MKIFKWYGALPLWLKLTIGLLALIALLLCALVVKRAILISELKISGVESTAAVVDISQRTVRHSTHDRSGNQSTRTETEYTAHVAYTDSNKMTHQFSFSMNHREMYKKGDSVALVYQAQNPKNVLLKSALDETLLETLFRCIMIIVFVVASPVLVIYLIRLPVFIPGHGKK